MPQYRRSRIPGGTYFFTVVTYQRQRFLTDHPMGEILWTMINEVSQVHPFTLDGWVFLPDHLHCLWTLPEGDQDFSKRWGLIKAGFSRKVKSCLPRKASLTTSRHRHRETTIWQRRFWEHLIRNDGDFRVHLDYIHYNPVKHGLVQRVRDWPHSSFHQYVQEGVYPPDWGDGLDLPKPETFGE